jgi:hypothetical protein
MKEENKSLSNFKQLDIMRNFWGVGGCEDA